MTEEEQLENQAFMASNFMVWSPETMEQFLKSTPPRTSWTYPIWGRFLEVLPEGLRIYWMSGIEEDENEREGILKNPVLVQEIVKLPIKSWFYGVATIHVDGTTVWNDLPEKTPDPYDVEARYQCWTSLPVVYANEPNCHLKED